MHSPEQVDLVFRLAAEGLSHSQVARITGLPRSTVRGWLTKRTPRFGAARTDCPVCCGHPDTLPAHHYLYLLGLYLGDGTLSLHPRGVYRLRISCADVYPSITNECAIAMRHVRDNRVGRVPASGCTHVYAYSKHWRCLLPQHGPGRKHNRKIELTGWQRDIISADPRPLIRGLVHSDGCRVLNRAAGTDYPPYPRYHFSNLSADILGIFGHACDAIGVEWRYNNATTISVARRPSVAILDSFIGPKR